MFKTNKNVTQRDDQEQMKERLLETHCLLLKSQKQQRTPLGEYAAIKIGG